MTQMSARKKQPIEFDPDSIRQALHDGLTNWRIELAITNRVPLLEYNFQKKGDDRQSLEQNHALVNRLLDVNPLGVWKKTTLITGFNALNSMYKGQITRGMNPDYVDAQTYIIARLMMDLNRIHRRQAPLCQYPEWLQGLIQKLAGAGHPRDLENSLVDRPPFPPTHPPPKPTSSEKLSPLPSDNPPYLIQPNSPDYQKP